MWIGAEGAMTGPILWQRWEYSMTSAVKDNRITRYVREVRAEIRKVTWPSRQEVIRMATVVVVVLMIMSIFMAVVDFGFSRLMQAIISLGSGL